MSEPNVHCALCCGLGRVADAPCQLCGGSGAHPAPMVKCGACRGERSDEFGDDCAACDGTGNVLACVECLVLPRDPMFAPACGGVCQEAWQAKQRLAVQASPVKRAP